LFASLFEREGREKQCIFIYAVESPTEGEKKHTINSIKRKKGGKGRKMVLPFSTKEEVGEPLIAVTKKESGGKGGGQVFVLNLVAKDLSSHLRSLTKRRWVLSYSNQTPKRSFLKKNS